MKSRTLLTLALLGLAAGTAGAQDAYSGPYHLETSPAKRIRANLTVTFHAPKLSAREWILFAARPPRLPGQPDATATMNYGGKEDREISPLGRPILSARVPVKEASLQQGITVQVHYQATLYARHLIAGRATKPVPPLASDARRSSLISTSTLDFEAPAFQTWLDKNRLRRRKNERAIAFAHRVYRQLATRYTYRYVPTQDRRASSICQESSTDCGGLSFLYTSILRANGVPARALVGRWALTARKPEDYGMAHVKAEFYADGVGWIPVDVSSAVSFKGEPDRFFGNDPGDHLTLHTDTDLAFDTATFGKVTLPWTQGVLHWVVGSGTLENRTEQVTWQVRELPRMRK